MLPTTLFYPFLTVFLQLFGFKKNTLPSFSRSLFFFLLDISLFLSFYFFFDCLYSTLLSFVLFTYFSLFCISIFSFFPFVLFHFIQILHSLFPCFLFYFLFLLIFCFVIFSLPLQFLLPFSLFPSLFPSVFYEYINRRVSI